MRATTKNLKPKTNKQTKSKTKQGYLICSQSLKEVSGKEWSEWRWTLDHQACRKRLLDYEDNSEIDVRGLKSLSRRISQLVFSDYVTQVTLLREWIIRKRDKIRDSTTIPIKDQDVQDVEDSEKELPSGYFETMLIDQVLFERLGSKLSRNNL